MEDHAVIGLWGPRTRDVIQKITTADISHASFPYSSAKDITTGSIHVFAQRVTYVGELGWELYGLRDKAIFAWTHYGQPVKITKSDPVDSRP